MAARPPAQRPSHEQPIPLTPEDLLDPELGDEVTQSGPHFNTLLLLANLLRGHYESRDGVLVAGDMKIFWGFPASPIPPPTSPSFREYARKTIRIVEASMS